MTLARRLARASVAAAVLVGAAAFGIEPRASAETGVSVVDKCSAPSDGSRMRIDMLVLLDVSGSLRANDPDNIRIKGTKDAILVLDSLSGQFENADIRVAVDSFHTSYSRQQDWVGADGTSAALIPRIDDIGTIPAGPTSTDYTQAMTGAWGRFGEGQADCRLLVWFTDGEHVTSGSAEGRLARGVGGTERPVRRRSHGVAPRGRLGRSGAARHRRRQRRDTEVPLRRG